MPRPSQHIDQRLLAAGLELLPVTGCRGLSARRLTEHADVNPGMFHYHFRTKDNFVRILLEQVYEQMFSMLVIQSGAADTPVANLRNALRVLALFGRAHHRLLLRIAADALAGEAVASDFLRANIPRHLGVLAGLIGTAQRDGHIEPVPLPQALAFLAGAIVTPVLIGSALLEHAVLPPFIGATLENAIMSEAAIDQRIDFALRGLTPTGKQAL